MDPEDNFSPPLDGISRGNKLNQVLTTLKRSELFEEVNYLGDESSLGRISGAVVLQEAVPDYEEDYGFGLLFCDWWHHSREPDWWKFEYLESGPEAARSRIEDSEDEREGVRIEITYHCGWFRQENDFVHGDSYFQEQHPGEDGDHTTSFEPFNPDVQAPKPLSRAIVDHYLQQNIMDRYEADQ